MRYPLGAHFVLVTVRLLSIHRGNLTQIATHIEVLKLNQIVKINCGCDVSVKGKKDKDQGEKGKNQQSLAKSKLIEMAP